MLEKIKPYYNRDFILEWTSTIILLIGVALTSLNIYPLNLWVCLLGNAGWALIGFLWRKWSLVVVQMVINAIYVFGLYKVYLI